MSVLDICSATMDVMKTYKPTKEGCREKSTDRFEIALNKFVLTVAAEVDFFLFIVCF